MTADRHVVMFSGGRGSYATALRVRDRHGLDGLVLLFADVSGEDEDTYRFLVEAAADVFGVPLAPPPEPTRDGYLQQAEQVPGLVWVTEGRTIWDVFRDKRYLGNSRVANCSHELKQKPSRAWLDGLDPATTTIYVGIGWDEQQRLAGVRSGYAHPVDRRCEGACRSLWERRTGRRLEGPGCRFLLPYAEQWHVEAPLTGPPYLDSGAIDALMSSRGIRRPRLYDYGLPHGNCGGGCVRSGMGQFLTLLEHRPDRYAEWEANEEALRAFLGKPVSIVREWPKGGARPITLRSLRERHEARVAEPEEYAQLDLLDVGGCGCFTDDGGPP